MKVFLLKDVEKIGMAGEIINVKDGFADNYLLPQKLAVRVTSENETSFQKKVKTIEHRKEVIASKTSLLAEKIKSLSLTLARKMHNEGKLYGSISEIEIVDALAHHGIPVSKSQVLFDKSIKEKGMYKVTIKLSSSLKPQVTVKIVPEVEESTTA